MKKSFVFLTAMLAFAMLMIIGCDGQPTADKIQQDRQETILKEGAAEVGMPSIKNFREMKLLKEIYELRDQNGLVTYMYIENLIPTVVKGWTACGGKFTFIANTIGYGIPAATQFTSPEKAEFHSSHGYVVLPQADPNGLFSPGSSEATWVMMQNPKDPNDVRPAYSEPRIFVLPFKLPMD